MKLILVQVVMFWYLLEKGQTQDIHHYQHFEGSERYKKPVIPILKNSYERYHGGYKYRYETGNGIRAEETGYIKHKGDEKQEILVQQGSVTYHDEHGRPITLTYIADEHGFQPQGEHLPTPPPVPQEIQKAVHDQSLLAGPEVHEEQEEYGQELQYYGH